MLWKIANTAKGIHKLYKLKVILQFYIYIGACIKSYSTAVSSALK
jgi:hypothetical protein